MATEKLDEKVIFNVAREISSPAARANYLHQVCGADPVLRERVETLLNAYQEHASFLESPPIVSTSPTIDQAPNECPGTIIGPYKLLQQIGEGGMGIVFMAEQTKPVQRKVALKVIKPGMDSKQVIARFEAERQALAMMDHVNIARVFDGGTTESGRPYFVMELVHGIPITKYCDDNHLTPRERLELFIPVCQAIQHAHQKGVIHRDIKPSNVLVTLYDGKPVAKVIDFGVAKATEQKLTERTMFTNFGMMVGTLEYMSPEQAEMSALGVDTRSDIYSLGVLLYELLTGSTPISRQQMKLAAYAEVLRMIKDEEPPRPSTRLSTSGVALATIAAQRKTEPTKLTKLMRGELDWIVMKALEKDRNRRYETVNNLAHDIERYLRDETVTACPPSAWYQLRKLVRRRKGAVLSALFLMLAIVGGVGLVLWHNYELDEKNRELLVANEAEKKAKESAERHEAQIKAVLEFVENKVFAAARPEGNEGGLGHDVTLRKALEAALPFVEKSFKDQPLVEAHLRYTLGRTFSDLGDDKLAAEQYEADLAISTKHLGPDHIDTLNSQNNLANCYETLGRNAEALKLHEETLALRKAKLGPDHPDTLGSMGNLAICYRKLGRHADALKLQQETLVLEKAKLGPNARGTLGTMVNLADTYYDLGRLDLAVKLYEEVLPIMKANIPEDQFTLICMDHLANTYDAFCRYADALTLRKEALALLKSKLGPRHSLTLDVMASLANSYEKVDQIPEAIALAEERLRLLMAHSRPGDPRTAAAMIDLADCLVAGRDAKSRDPDRAIQLAVKVTELFPKYPSAWCILGTARYRRGDWNEAIKHMEKTLSGVGMDNPSYVETGFILAMAYWQQGDKDKARTWFAKAVQWMKRGKMEYALLKRYRAEAAELLGLQQK